MYDEPSPAECGLLPADVRILYGASAAQLTQHLLEVAAPAFEKSYWLVPTEYHRHALMTRHKVDKGAIATFPQLAHRLAVPPEGSVLPESHQRLLLDQLLHQLGKEKELAEFRPLLDQPGFVATVFSFLSELRGLGITAEKFRDAARQLGGKTIRSKDAELALVLDRYQRLLTENNWFDRALTYEKAESDSAKAAEILTKRFRLVLVDGFTEFTDIQLELLARLSQFVVGLWISLPEDIDPESQRPSLFSVVKKTAASLHQRMPGLRELRPQSDDDPRPASLQHLLEHIFVAEAPKIKGSKELQLIEAPGLFGEVKLVARAVKRLLLDGTKPDDVVVSMRSLKEYADLVQEVFVEYGIPIEIEGTLPLSRQPIIALLLKAARLPLDNWPFAKTATILRSGFLRPQWAELANDAEIPLDAELLLRMLGEPEGKPSYLKAAETWAVAPQPGLEDEEAEGSKRRRIHELAKRCLPFLQRFFSAWDGFDHEATLAEHIVRLRTLSEDLGLTKSVQGTESVALESYWNALEEWSARIQQLEKKSRKITSAEFLHIASSIAALQALPRTDSGTGRVRVIPADLAAGLSYDHLFLMGLGERSFPNLSGGPDLYNEAERREFNDVGIELQINEQRLDKEQLLFYRLISGARHSITFSYPAMDEQGQQLLPATFLRDVCHLFDDIPTTRRRMLVEGLDEDQPLSPSEYRWRWATAGGDHSAIPTALTHNLEAARHMAAIRFREQNFGRFDGLLTHRQVVAEVEKRLGPTTEFSATSLENYVACPFKFFAGSALKLAELDEPGEDLEVTSRGLVYHRALARVHREESAAPADESKRLSKELNKAIEEEERRASSPITRALWQIERRRLQRFAARFGGQSDRYRENFKSCGTPKTTQVELAFGSRELGGSFSLTSDGVEIRLTGRIDRIDMMDLENGDQGFWIVDYKTGKKDSYTGKQVARLASLQLPVYTLVAEKVLSSERPIRPLGMLYWLPLTTGSKFAVPSKPTAWIENDGWPDFKVHLEKWLAEIVRRIRTGQFPLSPRRDDCTSSCEFGKMCRITQSRHIGKAWSFELPIIEVEDHE